MIGKKRVSRKLDFIKISKKEPKFLTDFKKLVAKNNKWRITK